MKLEEGDIFKIKNKSEKGFYFQFLYEDKDLLGGEVIRVFESNGIKTHDLTMISDFPVQKHFYTFVLIGVESMLWEKIGNVKVKRKSKRIIWRSEDDFKDDMWYLWSSHKPNKRNYIESLSDKDKQLPIAAIVPPKLIHKYILTGVDDSYYE